MKEMKISRNLFDRQLIIEEEFCRQVNKGIQISPEDAKVILDFAKRAGEKWKS